MVKYAFLFTSYLLLFTNNIFGQCNIPFAPNIVLDEDIPIMCDGINDFCSQLPDIYTQMELPGCDGEFFSIHNAHLISFIAGSSDLLFDITPSNCIQVPNGIGIQAVLYEGNHPIYEQAIPVHSQCGDGFESVLNFEVENLMVGKRYFLMIDGWDGSICEYLITVLAGSTIAPTGLMDPQIIAPEGVCEGSNGIFFVESFDACYFSWSVTGGTFDGPTNGTSVEVNVTDFDLFSICVQSTNFCDSSNLICTSVMEIAYMELDSIISDSICLGDTYSVNGMFYTEEGNYNFLDTIDCEIINFDLSLSTIEVGDTSINFTTCIGSCYHFMGQDLCEAGDYEFSLVAENGCDSLIFVSLELVDPIPSMTDAEICEGMSYEWNGEVYDMPGIYEIAIELQDGCDSIAILNLLLKENIQTFNISICSNESYEFDGVVYDSETTVENVYTDSEGCDSIRILNLSVEQVHSESVSYDICDGDSLFFAGGIFTDAGNYQIIQENPNQCDSVIFLMLNVLDTFLIERDTGILVGDTYNDIIIINDTTFIETYASIDNCDSTIITNVYIISKILKHDLFSNIKVFPNPFKDEILLTREGGFIQGTHLVLIDLQGQEVYMRDLNYFESNSVVNVHELIPGTYFLIVQNDQLFYREKLIKY